MDVAPRLLRATILGVTVAGGVALASFPFRTWLDQQDQIDQARNDRELLQVEIAELDAEIEATSRDEALLTAARCFGPYVPEGTEVYAVPGLDGCVSAPEPAVGASDEPLADPAGS